MATAPRRDPLLTSARREAWMVGAVAATATVVSVVVCWTLGYGRDPASIRLIAGFPDWVFWGVLVPWGSCYLWSAWFSLAYMDDGPLADSPDPLFAELAPPGEPDRA